MIGNKLEQSIINVFQEDLSSTFNINQVSKILKKSYPLINKKSNIFLKEGILKKLDVGRSYQCFLNMHNDKAKVLMALNEISRREEFIQKNKGFETIIDELQQITKKFEIDTVILYKKTIIFVTPNKDKKKEIMELTILTKNYTLLFLDKKSFQELFMEDQDIRKYYLIIHNVDICLNMITEVADKLIVEGLIKK